MRRTLLTCCLFLPLPGCVRTVMHPATAEEHTRAIAPTGKCLINFYFPEGPADLNLVIGDALTTPVSNRVNRRKTRHLDLIENRSKGWGTWLADVQPGTWAQLEMTPGYRVLRIYAGNAERAIKSGRPIPEIQSYTAPGSTYDILLTFDSSSWSGYTPIARGHELRDRIPDWRRNLELLVSETPPTEPLIPYTELPRTYRIEAHEWGIPQSADEER